MSVKVSSDVFEDGMKLSDFEVGKTFWTATGQWLVNKIDGGIVHASKVYRDVIEFDSADFGGCYPTKAEMEEDV